MGTIRRIAIGVVSGLMVLAGLVAAAPAATAAPAAGTAVVSPAATCSWTVIGYQVAVRWEPYVGADVYTWKYPGDRVTGPCGVTVWNRDEQRLWQALDTRTGLRVWIASEWIR
jgi:hypothetical protein